MPANGSKNLKRSGRPKGVPNKASADVRVRARALVEDPVYVLGIKRRMLEGKSVPLEIMLHHYAYGKPRETVEVEGAVTIKVVKPW
tara:strand:+ start:1155 stop:1412 length:258 start_codon:yes stop_codon:yes gene_type:complete